MTAHLANARHVIKRIDEPLHVIVPLFNPIRYVTRYNLFKEFIKHAEDSGAVVWVPEIAFGERPFEFDASVTNVTHIKLRSSHEIWHKETAINIAASKLPLDAKYIAWVDGDITFLNPDWVHETIQQLQHYPVVQMFTDSVDAGSSGEFLSSFEGFAASYLRGRPLPTDHQGPSAYYNAPYYAFPYYGKGGFWHPGYAWGYRREAWDTLGGMLDINLVGGGDYQMALSLIGLGEVSLPEGSTANYRNAILNWQYHALDLKKNIGHVPGTIVHHWHGKKAKRGYFDRWKILTDNNFDPTADIRRDTQMLWALTGNKPQLRDDLRSYFRSRCEDEV